MTLPGGCTTPPIEWSAPEYQAAAVADDAAPDPRFCATAETSLRGTRVRAGWSRSGGELLVVKSPDNGVNWEPPVLADDRQQDTPPCNRPPPAAFADSANRFLHLVYFSDVRGGPGVYYVHSMNVDELAARGEGMFEQPLALTYGARPVRTAVASRGDTVVAAYEDPNSPRGAIQLAISSTAGHSFAVRQSVPGAVGVRPAVELRAGELTVSWRETQGLSRIVRRRGSFR